MEFIQKMMSENKEECKQNIINLFDSFNSDNFLQDLNDIGFKQLEELGIIHSYSISIGYDNKYIYVYLDNRLSLRYKYVK